MKLDTDSLAHTRWNCKYHIVFEPKYRRQIIYGKIKADIGMMLRKLCEYKGVEILEAEACKDHIHMLQYIRNELQQDYEEEQLSIKEFVDPFAGQPIKEGK